MRPVLIDTNAYTDFKKGDTYIIEVIKDAASIVISPIVIGELLGGFDKGSKSKENREEMQKFLNSSRIRMLSITSDTSNFYCQLYCNLRNKGRPIPTNDLWIAAQALEHGCVLCTRDKHFKYIDGLISGITVSELFI